MLNQHILHFFPLQFLIWLMFKFLIYKNTTGCITGLLEIWILSRISFRIHMGYSCCLISQEIKVLQRCFSLVFYDRSQESCQELCHTVRWAAESAPPEKTLVELHRPGSGRVLFVCLQNIS